MKDNFSAQSQDYARFRPGYSDDLFQFLLSVVPDRKCAWDCATGNGQAAGILSSFFEQVYATDISQQQIENAVRKENIKYSIQPAERTSFADDQFDLVTVAQAIHWFDFADFFKEVKRVVKKDGIIAVIGYNLLRIEPAIDQLIQEFYTVTMGDYWDPERKFIDEGYQTIPFPFEIVPAPAFSSTYRWRQAQLLGYISTWSAVQHYINKNNVHPVSEFSKKIAAIWPEHEEKKVVFPLLLRVGRINK